MKTKIKPYLEELGRLAFELWIWILVHLGRLAGNLVKLAKISQAAIITGFQDGVTIKEGQVNE